MIATRTITLGSRTAIKISAWAVIRGRPQYLVASGSWSGYWIREGTGISLAIVP